MRTRSFVGLVLVLGLAASPAARATNYYYVGGPQPPGVSGDDSWRWRHAGIQEAYDDIQATGAGDWDIRVHADYQQDVGAGNIELALGTVAVNRVQGAMTWTTGAPGAGPLGVAQDLSNKSEVVGSGANVINIHNEVLTLDGFALGGPLRITNNAGGTVVLNCHVSGGGTGTGIYVGDNNHRVYVMNTLVEGFEYGLRYLDTAPTRTTYVVHSTIADNLTGISNDQAPWEGRLHFYNTVIAADNIPVDETNNKRVYSYSDVYDRDGSFDYDGTADAPGVYDINLDGTSIRQDPQLQPDFTLGGGPCVNSGGIEDGGTFLYVNVDSPTDFNPDTDVVVAGTPPPNARYVILTDINGNPRVLGSAPDMGAFEGPAPTAPVPEPGAGVLLLAAMLGLGRRRRTGRGART